MTAGEVGRKREVEGREDMKGSWEGGRTPSWEAHHRVNVEQLIYSLFFSLSLKSSLLSLNFPDQLLHHSSLIRFFPLLFVFALVYRKNNFVYHERSFEKEIQKC